MKLKASLLIGISLLIASLPASATLGCFNQPSYILCTGPAQDLIVEVTTGQTVTDWGSFPRAVFSLSGVSQGQPCGTGTTARKAVLDGAAHGAFNLYYSTFLSAFALNQDIAINIMKDANCTISTIRLQGKGSATTQPCQQTGAC